MPQTPSLLGLERSTLKYSSQGCWLAWAGQSSDFLTWQWTLKHAKLLHLRCRMPTTGRPQGQKRFLNDQHHSDVGFKAANLHDRIFCMSAFAGLGFECMQTCRLIAINLSDLEAETRCPVCLGKCTTVASAIIIPDVSRCNHSGCVLI